MVTINKSKRLEWDINDVTIETEIKIPYNLKERQRIQYKHKVIKGWIIKDKIEINK